MFFNYLKPEQKETTSNFQIEFKISIATHCVPISRWLLQLSALNQHFSRQHTHLDLDLTIFGAIFFLVATVSYFISLLPIKTERMNAVIAT